MVEALFWSVGRTIERDGVLRRGTRTHDLAALQLRPWSRRSSSPSQWCVEYVRRTPCTCVSSRTPLLSTLHA